MMYFNDHPPPHVHVRADGGEAIFDLVCPDGPPELRVNFGLPFHKVSSIHTELSAHITALCEKWKRIHGDLKRGI